MTPFSRLKRLWRELFGTAPRHPALAAHLLAQARRDNSRPLDELEFVAVDTELTGFDSRRDAMVSIAAVRLRGLSISPGDTFHTLLRPDRDVPRESSLIHRLTAAELADAPPVGEALEGFLAFLGSAVLVGHHVDLDMDFLCTAARRHLGGNLDAPCIDTLRLAMIFEEKRLTFEGGVGDFEHVGYSLPMLCRRYRLPAVSTHDARSDAMAAAYLFLYLAKKLGRGRDMTLAGLWRAGRLWWT